MTLSTTGFMIYGHRLEVFGACPGCREATKCEADDLTAAIGGSSS